MAATHQSVLRGVYAEMEQLKALNQELQHRTEQQGERVAGLSAELSAADSAHKKHAVSQKQQQSKLHAQVAAKSAEVQQLQVRSRACSCKLDYGHAAAD